MGFAPTWLQHLNPPLHKITLTTEAQVFVPCPRAVASLEDAEGDQHLAGGHISESKMLSGENVYITCV